MALEDILKSAADKMASSGQDEAQIKQSVILPILQALDWDIFNAAEVRPEFPTGNGSRVDYALCDTHGSPWVFMEAKRPGRADESGETQVFDYANNKGVPFLILTDGSVWNFYLSMAQGERPDRRFYRAELRRGDKHAEYAKVFGKYLRKSVVISGAAKTEAEKSHASEKAKSTAKNSIPAVWRNLLSEPDDLLRELLAEAVEGDCGIKPAIDDVESFLQTQGSAVAQQPLSAGKASSAPVITNPPPTSAGKKIAGFVLDGQEYRENVANRVLAKVLIQFQQRDPGFLPRFAALTVGRTRRLVAPDRDNLYDQSDLVEFSVELADGWWLGTNLSVRDVRKNIMIACEVANVKFGSRLTLIER